MTTPAVWNDAKARIEAGAFGLDLAIAWPNEAFSLPADPIVWLLVETHGDLSDPLGLGGEVWQELGEIVLHVMVPVGTGLDAGLAARQSLANLFRQPAGLAEGLQYRSFRFDPLGAPADDGLYRPLSLAVLYSYQDR